MKTLESGRQIRERREALKISQAELARRVGIKQPSLHNIEIGKTKRSRYLPDIAQVLGLDSKSLKPSGLIDLMDSQGTDANARGHRDFPVFFMKPAPTGGVGFELSMERVEYAERPTLLATVKDSYAVCIYGDDMSPAYNTGDTVFVHPHRPPVVDADFVFRQSNIDDTVIIIGRLEAETETEWQVLQHKRSQTIKLKKAEWGLAHRIIAKHNRL